jgi:hypothetical protein
MATLDALVLTSLSLTHTHTHTLTSLVLCPNSEGADTHA